MKRHSPGQRALIVGRTGSGKSALAYKLVRDYVARYPTHGLVIINPKLDEGWNSLLPPVEDDIPAFKAGMKLNWAVLPGQEDEVEEFLWQVYRAGRKRQPTLVVYDEGADVGHNLRPLNTLFTQGRALRVGVIYLTQRPSRIPIYAPTQADDYYIFNMLGRSDLSKLEEYMYEVRLNDYLSPKSPMALKQYEYLHYNIPTASASVEQPVEYDTSALFSVQPRSYTKWLKIGTIGLILTAIFKL